MMLITTFVSSKMFFPCLFFISMWVAPFSWASVSENCQTELKTLLNNPALAVTNGGTCDYDLSGSVWCTYDYANITTDFENACRQTGGKPYQDDFICSFRQDVSGVTAKVDNYYRSYPFCAGASCSDTEIQELFASNVTEALQEVLPNFECAVSASLLTGATHTWYIAVMVVSVIVITVSCT